MRLSLLVIGLPAAGSPAGAADLFIATADKASGSAALLGDGHAAAQPFLLSLHTNVRLRFHDNRIYILQGAGRGQVLTVIPSAWRAPSIEMSTGAGSDPRDVAVLPDDELYLSLHNAAAVVRVDAYSGDVLFRIDLSALDVDGIPGMTDLLLMDDRLFVLCERQPPLSGTVAVIDVATEQPIDMDRRRPGLQGIELVGQQPRDMLRVGAELLLLTSAGVEALDPSSGTGRVVISAASFPGEPQRLALRSNRQGFVAVRAETHLVVPVDVLQATVGAPLQGLTGGPVNDLVIDDGRLFIADDGTFEFDFGAGVYVYDTTSGAQLQGPISTGQKPKRLLVVSSQKITAVRDEPVRDEAGTRPALQGLQAPFPNPFNAGIVLPVDMPAAGRATLTIYDVLGRPLRNLWHGRLPAGVRQFYWDGRDDSGAPVASGTYLAHLVIAGHVRTREFTLVR